MSISRQNLSIVIVTFKSEMVVHECIKSIDHDIQIIIVENSNNSKFKIKNEPMNILVIFTIIDLLSALINFSVHSKNGLYNS